MGKKEDLKRLDDLYRAFLIQTLESKQLDIKDASQIVQYLKANEVTSQREKDSEEDKVRQRVEEANAKRKQHAERND